MKANSHELLVLCRDAMRDALGREIADDEVSFFTQGGTSLDAVRWMMEIAERTGVQVRLADVFDAPSPAALSRLLFDRAGRVGVSTTPDQRLHAVSEQHLLRLAARRQSLIDGVELPNSGPNILVNGFRLTGALDVEHLAAAVEIVVDRHDLLRAVFHDDVPPYKVSAVPRSYGLEVYDGEVDLVGLRAPFDLGAGQFARFWLVRRDQDVHELWVAIEHLVADGTSFDLVLRDLVEVYDQLRRGDRPQLPPPMIAGVALGAHEIELAKSATAEASRDYYAEALAGGVPWQPVIGDHVGPPESVRLDRALRGGFALTEPQVGQLVDRCAAAGSSLLATVVASVAAAMHDVAGVSMLTAYCVVSNRGSALAETVGPIASVVPVRVDGGWTRTDGGRDRISADVRRALASSTYSFYRYAREHGARIAYQVSPIAVVNVFPRANAEVFRLDGLDVAELPDTYVAPLKPGISFEVVYSATDLEFSVTCPAGFLSETRFAEVVDHARRDLCHIEVEAELV